MGFKAFRKKEFFPKEGVTPEEYGRKMREIRRRQKENRRKKRKNSDEIVKNRYVNPSKEWKLGNPKT